MTIGVGFRCDMGIVLCADTQITWEGKHKAYESKISYLSGIDWTMASVYAGDPHLMKSFRDKLRELVQLRPHGKESSAAELREIIETALCCFDDLDSNPMALSLIVGIIIPSKEIRLLKTEGKVISDVPVFDYVGCGDSSLLRYLAPITVDDARWPTISQALYSGTYWVLQAKQWIDGCGGDTDAFVLHWDGRMHRRSPATPNWEQHLLRLQLGIAKLLTTLGDAEISENEVENRLSVFCEHFREEHALCIRGL